MPNSYALGLGGTGSKSLEAFLHLAAAGLGPLSATVGLVDQDATNGNVARARKTLKSYRRQRQAFRGQAAAHRLPESDPLPFLATEIESFGAGFWCPVADDQRTNLARYFGKDGAMAPDLAHLMDVLYAEADQRASFDVGFRGRPSVGAPIIVAQADPARAPFWRDLFQGARAAGGGGGSRFVLFGSAFGGTGASALPTIARLIRNHAQAENQGNVQIAGVLLTPYFLFPDPPNRGEEVVAESTRFLQQTQGALNYYGSLLSRQEAAGHRLFDTLYVIGWSPLIGLPTFKAGGSDQANPPLVPELLAGLAACDFFARGAGATDRLRVLGWHHEDQPFTWRDLPAPGGGGEDGPDVAGRLGQLLHFCYQYARIYHPMLTEGRDTERRRFNWYETLVRGPAGSTGLPEARRTLDDLQAYALQALRWLVTCADASNKANQRVLLFNHNLRYDPDYDSDGLVLLPETVRNRELKGTQGLVTDAERWSTAAQLYCGLVDAKPHDDAQQLGVFVDRLYRLCAPIA